MVVRLYVGNLHSVGWVEGQLALVMPKKPIGGVGVYKKVFCFSSKVAFPGGQFCCSSPSTKVLHDPATFSFSSQFLVPASFDQNNCYNCCSVWFSIWKNTFVSIYTTNWPCTVVNTVTTILCRAEALVWWLWEETRVPKVVGLNPSAGILVDIL